MVVTPNFRSPVSKRSERHLTRKAVTFHGDAPIPGAGAQAPSAPE
jgi:hypothetical protein